MTMLRSRGTSAVVAGILAMVAACGGGGGGPALNKDFVIGVITVTSGPAADVSSVATRGAYVAAADANARGGVHGRTVRLEVCDNGSPQGVSDPQKTIACARRFLGEGLPALAIEDEGSLQLVVNELTARRVFATGGYSEHFDDPQKYPYVFSLVSPSAIGAAILVKLFQAEGVHRVATMTDTSASQIATTRIVEDGLRRAGIQVVDSETFGLADTDVSAQTSKVIASHPDVVWVNSYGLVVAHVVEDFLNAHVGMRILGSQAFANTPVVLLLGLTEIPNLRLQTYVSATGKHPGEYTAPQQHLVDALHRDGKGPISKAGTIFLAEYGYDLISLITHAFDAAPSEDPAVVRTSWEQLHLTRASGQIYTQDVLYPAGHHAPGCDPTADDVSYGTLPDANGFLTEAEPPLDYCP